MKPDVLLKDFWRSNERFADLFNAVMFHGEEVLRPEELQEMDTDVSGIIQLKDHAESLVRIRDVVKKMAFGVEFVVFGIESQQNIHYAMPLRAMLYDGMGYLKEYQEITRSHKAEKAVMSKEEFLSGMKKGDRLHPIISIVIYYSEYPWDGPLCLEDMMVEMPEEIRKIFSDYKMNLVQVQDSGQSIVIYYSEYPWDGPLCLEDMMVEMPEEIRKIFSDYKMNLVQVQDSGQYVFHNEDVRLVFELSREFFRGDLEKIKEKYKNQDIKQELLMVIGKIIDSSELMHWKQEGKVENVCTAGDLEKIKEKYKNQDIKQELLMVIGKIIDSSELMHWKQEGKVENVCTAVKKWEKEWYENGRIEGHEEGRKEGRIEGRKTGITDMVSAMQKHGIAHDLIIQMLCGQFEISEEEAKQYL